MRNKWYVIGLLVPTVLLAWVAVSWGMGDGGWMSIVPGSLAVLLGIAAVRVARADSFAPAARGNWNSGQTVGMTRWLKHRAADAADVETAKTDAARASRRPPATP